MNLCIIGPSGSGKGTQAKKIAAKYKLTHISTGELLRQILRTAKKDQTTQKIRHYLKLGQWVPSDIIFAILKNKLKDNFLLDGTPRYLKQCSMLEKLLKSRGLKLDACIYLALSRKEWEKRRKSYGDKFQDKTRNDNSPEIQEKRWHSGEKTLDKIVAYYRNLNKLIEIDGNRPVEPIFQDIVTALDSLKK